MTRWREMRLRFHEAGLEPALDYSGNSDLVPSRATGHVNSCAEPLYFSGVGYANSPTRLTPPMESIP